MGITTGIVTDNAPKAPQRKGENGMSEHKMGTHYVREVAEMFKATAAGCKSAALKSKLESLAADIEPLAAKLYFKTQKGTEDMERISAEMGDLKAKVASMDAAAAENFCKPFFDQLDKIVQHVKTMKVRMT